MSKFEHIPVLLCESVEYLTNGRSAGIFVDATLGGGGTTEKILEVLNNNGKVLSIDSDPTAIEMSALRLRPYPNLKVVRGNFRELEGILKESGIDAIDGIIYDLGVSSMQLDDASRGFSFRQDARLDMRMSMNSTETSAYDLLKSIDETSLKKLLREFGDERWAGRIASRIVEQRKKQAIETTAELAKLIEQAIPKRFHSRRIHPATRSFQAIRIAVNDELSALSESLKSAVSLLRPGGRIVVIAYHSLEDRIVKNFFRQASNQQLLRIITKKPITPSTEEIKKNPRSRSAKMRVAEKRQVNKEEN